MSEKVLVEVSARHVHVSKQDLETLFGAGHELTSKKELSQPGQFACEEKVAVVGPKGTINMSILGPTRKDTQIEVSYTDARALGINAPLRESGDTKESAPIKLVGPKGEVELTQGVIVAKRHIHMLPSDAEKFGVENGQIVGVKIDTNGRSIVFGDTVVRVRDDFALAMHIDTDEANAAGISGSAQGEIIK
ncbi:PduL/EutD family phosphate acyltransferase [Anaerorhabdus furcosa]|uniref:Phosphate propanoyltransferase n=1 Tax=Anaerorhabdus furcosa TaxID=118967 RepID=A0A1T4LX54_9FIRM|nr:phosphate propanoyltransferase [Anaerorhabdus furcosa]SJZ59237.1 putative phosphotransacetylase [Anaerorhabdus furcosa]